MATLTARISLTIAMLTEMAASIAASTSVSTASPGEKPQIMVVGAYHFVSKQNVHTIPVDDPLSLKRQAEIEDLVEHLLRFHPTKIVLEQTSGTSRIEGHYKKYLAGAWQLEASENYQIGFRLAKRLGHRRIYLINAHTPFEYERVVKFASSHGEGSILAEKERLDEEATARATQISQEGSVLQMYRFLNSEESIRQNNASYMFLARIGDDRDFVGADLVASWHLRNLQHFAKLTRVIDSGDDRILVLYGQGHAFLFREFIRESPDLRLVDAEEFLK